MSVLKAKNASRSTAKAIILPLFLVLFAQACSDMESVVRNKAETMIDGHQVVIQPCRSSYTKTVMDSKTKRHHIFACGETVKVEIKNEELTVNGKGYGMLGSEDSIIVKRGRVFINEREAEAVARN